MENMLFVCPECNVVNDVDAWNEATDSYYGGDAGKIEDGKDYYYFICPECKVKIAGEDIKMDCTLS